ncbi:putative integral membrane protein [Sedimentisphaera cyanobacteriorum]|uniref:Putative integral membrane protein n=1 Tax=Sedimentisphaera cyanobacteriorum TaxID=1940790 RepID=A0A1Q2HRW2_9BACT|nr:hypothetical protein [Sedimentisphaera cyanobacteriorum]AQQ10198.1 putative integral membrane protein [Sedimentisphaera cyanobacteriorum]
MDDGKKLNYFELVNKAYDFYKANWQGLLKYGGIFFIIMTLAQVPIVVYLFSQGYGENTDLIKFFKKLSANSLAVIFMLSVVTQLIGVCLITGLIRIVGAMIEEKQHSAATLTNCSDCFWKVLGCYFAMHIAALVPVFAAEVLGLGGIAGGTGTVIAFGISAYLVMRMIFALFFIAETKMTVRESVLSSLAMTGSEHGLMLKLILTVFAAFLLTLYTYGFATVIVMPFMGCIFTFVFRKLKQIKTKKPE